MDTASSFGAALLVCFSTVGGDAFPGSPTNPESSPPSDPPARTTAVDPYRARPEDGGWRAYNSAQRLAFSFGADGVTVTAAHAGWTFSLRLAAMGRGSARRATNAVAPLARDRTVRFAHTEPAVVEWYANGPRGLEQGFTIPARPFAAQRGRLALEVGTSGSLRPRPAGSDAIQLVDARGNPSLGYRHLLVLDRRGVEIPASMEIRGDAIVLSVDDAGASYPLVVDPLVTAGIELLAADRASGDGFGESVAVSRNRAIIGSPFDDDLGRDSGSAYIFVRGADGWRQEARITASDGMPGDWFGGSDPFNSAVAISGTRAVVGAHRHDTAGELSGAAYVYALTDAGWIEEQKLVSSDAAEFDRFGNSVDIDGTTVVVGAFTDDDNGSQSGAAYVFVRGDQGWLQKQKLIANDPGLGDQFGASVAIDADTILVSAVADAAPNNERMGSCYVFVRDAHGVWSQQAKLMPPDGGTDDMFGYHVGLHGDTAIIGSPLHDAFGKDSGAAYLFTRSNGAWSLQGELVPSDPAAGDVFGYDVDVHGQDAVVGAVFDDTSAGNKAGSVYWFRRFSSSWVEMNKIEAYDAAAGDTFGNSVAIDTSWILIGSEFHSHGILHAGGAYLLPRPRPSPLPAK